MPYNTLVEFLGGEAKSLVFGGLDGVCTSLALVWSGVAAGNQAVSSRSILVMGIAGLISQGFSMGLGNYLGGTVDSATAAQAFRSGLVMFASFVGFGIIPLLSCLVPRSLLSLESQIFLLVATTAFSLFLLGMLTGSLSKQSIAMSGMGMIATGLCAASVSFSVSWFLQHLLHTSPLVP
eukprot:TRINITY_DN58721_c0_g1_i1.p1 TRINITY_DN58721_c0_g1~~TRINITY_DN58721_c0_g1_i1.p1  ORF type:complete len:179 (+),score=39.32 TRINITY_DN58721_c0_g1_i1:42-578(+)